MRALVAALLLSAGPALAHSWYSPFCCGGEDCAPVAPDAIRCTAEGCTVTIAPGVHPKVPAGGVFTTTAQPKPSQDAQHHVCIVAGYVRCIYFGGGV